MTDLRAQFVWLRRHFDVLPLVEAVERCRSGDLSGPTACITFDDGYSTHATLAAPLLRELNLPATFCVTSGHSDSRLLWNDRLQVFFEHASAIQLADYTDLVNGQDQVKEHGSNVSSLQSLERQTKYLTIARRRIALDYIDSVIPQIESDCVMMSETNIATLSEQGFEIGAHTVDHPILALEEPHFARQQIADDIAAIKSITGKKVVTFAFPNGKPHTDYGYEHLEILETLGIEVALNSALGHFTPTSDQLQVPRVALEGSTTLELLRTIRRAYTARNDGFVSS